MYELVEFREPALHPGESYTRAETVLLVCESEQVAIEQGRTAWKSHRQTDSADVVWWIVREPGQQLARWLADGASDSDHVLDLTTNTLVPIDP